MADMSFRFDAKQEYQLQAIASVVQLLEGQPVIEIGETILQASNADGVPAIANRLDLDSADLLANLHAVQESGNLERDPELAYISHTISTNAGEQEVRFANFTVEMETGTGKTYVYLRTAIELFRRYGLRKFIIVVPSLAIREGVLKTLQITQGHFGELYQNPTYRYYTYDSASLTQVRQFALADGLEIMVMTLASFNRSENIIRQPTDRLQGETPLHLIQATRPILILDEPQNMESPRSKSALSSLNPLLALRYSATHRQSYNLVYQLTPFEAYRQGLVKRIEVAGLEEADNANLAHIRLDGINSRKSVVRAQLTVQKLLRTGSIQQGTITVGPGESLEPKTNRSEYGPYTVDEINPGGGFLRFTNGLELSIGEQTGSDQEHLWRAQIRYAVEEHFKKQQRLLPQNIKVLSLFFIDRVDNYALPGSIIRRLFDETFAEVRAEYADLTKAVWGTSSVEPEEVQAAYFASRRTRSGDLVFEDSATGEAEKDREVYDLIMRDKERLLSLSEPVAFIFSHSALREGWDNPNIFQICTLNQTVSEMKKRQEVGRGVRLAVNQTGERIHSEQVNVLTVVANEAYTDYVARLQSEYVEEYGERHTPPPPPDARKPAVARLRKAYLLNDEFKGLWDRIKYRTRYSVTIDTEQLVRDVLTELDNAVIAMPRIVGTKAQLQVTEEDTFEAIQLSGTKTLAEIGRGSSLPNVVLLIEEFLERTTPPVRVSRRTLLRICRETQQGAAMVGNPHEFGRVAGIIIRQKLRRQLVDGIQYEKTGSWYDMTQFKDEIRGWQEYLIPAAKCLYDHVIIDRSQIEASFAAGLESRDDVKLYVKLPSWFTVDTPIGEYNPDWAVVVEPRDEHGHPTGGEYLYLVRETKDPPDLDRLRPDEADKVRCGRKHFKDTLGVDFKVVASTDEL